MTRLLRAILYQLPPSLLGRLHVLVRLVRLRRFRARRNAEENIIVQLLDGNGKPDSSVYRKLLRDPDAARRVIEALRKPGAFVEVDGRRYKVERLYLS